jgi:predicted DNA-binding WGR domain protein
MVALGGTAEENGVIIPSITESRVLEVTAVNWGRITRHGPNNEHRFPGIIPEAADSSRSRMCTDEKVRRYNVNVGQKEERPTKPDAGENAG